MGDGGSELLVLVGKQNTEQRREQSQEVVVKGQSGAGLQAAEHLPEELLQLEEEEAGKR